MTVSSALPALAKEVTREGIRVYAQASGDHNPLHLDDQFAATTQFKGIIAHGMLTLAFVNEMLVQAFGKTWLQRGKLKVRFKAAAHPGDVLTTFGMVLKEASAKEGTLVECHVGVRNHRDEELISGTATAIVAEDELKE
jgi:3-hydroxybutyryl-CoA dehydratase